MLTRRDALIGSNPRPTVITSGSAALAREIDVAEADPLAEALSPREWREAGRRLAATRSHHEMNGSRQMWDIGDWLLVGEDVLFRNLKKRKVRAMAAEISNYSLHTLAMAVSVARKLKPSMRIEGLSWWHHLVAAGLDEAERGSWLIRAAQEKWTPKQFREQLTQQGHVPPARRSSPERRTIKQLLKVRRGDLDEDLLEQLRLWWQREIAGEG